MSLFKTLPAEERDFALSMIAATHEWGLPGVKCPECGNTWSNTGLAYPSLSLSDFPFEAQYRTPRAVGLEEFNSLRDRLAVVLPEGSLLLPGTEFGPLVGRANGTFGDFAWLNPWTTLIRNDAYTQLKEAGIHLPMSARHKLVFSKSSADTFVELQIEPLASLKWTSSDPADYAACPACGYIRRSLPDEILVLESSVPDHFDLFRAKDFTTLILATDKFVNATKTLGLTGIAFHEVDVSFE